MDCHWPIFGEDNFWRNTDLHFSNASYLNIKIVEVILSMQLNKAKIDIFVDNKILNKGQFYYWILKPLFGEDIFDGKYHQCVLDSKWVFNVDKFLPSSRFQKVLSILCPSILKNKNNFTSSMLLNPTKFKKPKMRQQISAKSSQMRIFFRKDGWFQLFLCFCR